MRFLITSKNISIFKLINLNNKITDNSFEFIENIKHFFTLKFVKLDLGI